MNLISCIDEDKVGYVNYTQLQLFLNNYSTTNNYFVFLSSKGTVKMIIELLQIKGSNYILVHLKYCSGIQEEFTMMRKQILTILNHFRNTGSA